MSQQSFSRYWLVVGLFLSLNTAGIVWIRHAWDPHRASRLVILDVTPQTNRTGNTPDRSDGDVSRPVAHAPQDPAPPQLPAARIVAWLPVSNFTSALTPENVLPDVAPTSGSPTSTSFDGAERLLAVFDRPIVDERDLNRPLEHLPFQIFPQIPGHWRWTSTNRLAFVLAQPLAAGRRYQIKAAVDFTEQTRAELHSASHDFQFETRPLVWLGAALRTSDRDAVTLELSFNQPVAPADLLRGLVLSDASFPAPDPADARDAAIDGRNASSHRGPVFDAAVLSKEAGSTLTVRTQRPSGALRIALAPSLTGHGGERPLGPVPSRSLVIPTAFAFIRSQINPESFDDDVTVQLYFSTGLSADQQAPKVTVTPPVPDLRTEFSPGQAGAESYHAGIVLRGRFLCGQRYTLAIPGTILSHDGQTLGESKPVVCDIPHRPADLQLTAGRGILIPDGNLTLDLRCVNIDGVRLSASRLHANNLAAYLQGRDDSATMRSIVQERMRSLDLPQDVAQVVALDLKQLLGADKNQGAAGDIPGLPPRGIYRVTVADAGEYWNRDMANVAITDLGLTAKRGRDGWLVWVLSLRSAEPLAGVTVTARSFNNQVLAQGVTDASGIASLSIPDNHPDGAAWLLTAERNDDLNFLIPDRHAWMVDTVDQSGRAWPDHYEAMLYTERGVYRPGDTVHLTGILRDRLGHRPPPFPLEVTVTRPDGRVVARLPCQPLADRQGIFQVDYPSAVAGQTGVYRFDVGIPGAATRLGTVSAQIEAFVPVRIAVEASPLKPRFIGEVPVIHAAARYLFGQPAAGLDVAVSGTWQRTPFQSARYPGYTFGDFSGRNQQQLAEVRRQLGDDGGCDLNVATPKDERPGVWTAAVATTVTETGGRSVSTSCRVEVDTAGIHLGVTPPEKQVVAVDAATRLDWVILDGQGNLVPPRPLQMSLVRVDCDTTVAQVNGRPVWKNVERLIAVHAEQVPGSDVAASGLLNLACPVAGRYRLRLVDPATASATQIEFYASTSQTDHVDVPLQEPERLELVLDQSQYLPGDLARVLVRAPFPGRLLLTLEGDRVYHRHVVAMEGNSQLIEVPVPAELRGGAYLTATVIRGVDPQRTDWLPHRACGLARLTIDPATRTLPVKLTADPRALPGSTLKVRALVDWAGAARPDAPADAAAATRIAVAAHQDIPVVHLWAVDEGILMASRYVTPRPLDFFHKPRRPGVTSSDVYSTLLPDHMRPASMIRIGADAGDADGELDSLRRGPIDVPRTAPAVIWQGVQPVGDDGSLVIDLPVPPLTGTLRLMAVAVYGDRYGSAEHRVTVTSPLLVESTWPRCAAPGDHFKVPVKLFNTTTAPLDVTVRTVASGPVTLQFTGKAGLVPTLTASVAPGQPLLHWLQVTGTGLGPATILIEATATAADGTSLTALSESSLAVRCATPLDSETSVTRHPVGKPVTIEPAPGFLNETTRTSISISSLPSANLTPALDSLIDYPYGCAEQTASRLTALLAARNWMNADSPPEGESSRQRFVAQLIDAGIVRLWSMQNRNGGIGYWASGPSSPWVSAYAAGALVAARDAGHAVDAQLITDLARYLESVLDGQAGVEVDDNTRAHLCLILASVDRPKQGWMARLSESLDTLDAEGRAHLAAAWIRLGRKDRATAVLPEETLRLAATAAASGRITSRVRQDAVLLQVLLQLQSQPAAVPVLVQRLQSARQNQAWMNTLENAAAISALAQYRATAPVQSDFTGTLQAASDQRTFSHASPLYERRGGNAPLSITSEGKGEFYVVRTTEGLRQQQIAPYDRQLKVRRQWRDRNHRPIDPTRLRVGDLVHVEIQVSTPGVRNSIPNVAIVDPLPGGVEIENPRLATSASSETAGPSDDTGGDQAEHVEFLDDRAVLFTAVGAATLRFRYTVRVTTAGQFEWPPVQASSMYDPGFASVHGGGRVVIFGRDETIGDVAERPDQNATNRD